MNPFFSSPYGCLTDAKPSTAAESHAPYTFLTERHLQIMWHQQKYFNSLTTSTGAPIEILSPGIWNAASGPDFCKAHLRIGGHEMRGDIEIHLVDDGWTSHGHDQDGRYDRVILHLSLWKPTREKPLMNTKGHPIHRAYLEPNLTLPINKLLSLIDLDLYPYEEFKGSGRCATSIFQEMSDEDTVRFFESAAGWRLTQKKQFLSQRIPDPIHQMAGGIAMGLGYKHNSEAFLDLFLALLPFRHLSEPEILALALGMCGFFEEKGQDKWSSSEKYQSLSLLWGGLAPQALHQASLRIDRTRPLNHPVRRLAYLAKMLSDKAMDRLYMQLCSLWKSYSRSCTAPKQCRMLQKLMREALPSYADPYWNHHFTFEEKEQTKPLTLIGDDLKNAILINTFLPLLHHEIKHREGGENQEEMEAFRSFYRLFPAAENSKMRYLTHRFFGNTTKKDLLSTASLEQGAYQLHRDFCIHFEASCIGCPFVDRYQKQHKNKNSESRIQNSE